MRLWRIVLAATAFETSAVAALLGVLMLLSASNGWLDALTNFAPVVADLGAVGGLLALASIRAGGQRNLILALAGVGIFGAGVRMAPEWLRPLPHRPVAANEHPLQLVTFNVWDEDFDIPKTVNVILAADADVVALQETNGFLAVGGAALRARYPYMVQCRPAWQCGDALLSKRPILGMGAIKPHEPVRDGDLTLLWMTTMAPDGRPVTVATTHLTWPIPPGPQALQRRRLVDAVHAMAGPDTILMGDFNLTPWSDDLRQIDSGLKPLVRRTHGMATWPANIPKTEKPSPAAVLPIDQVFAGPDWNRSEIAILPRAGSDHYGVFAVLFR